MNDKPNRIDELQQLREENARLRCIILGQCPPTERKQIPTWLRTHVIHRSAGQCQYCGRAGTVHQDPDEHSWHVATSPHALTDVRAQQVFVADYVTQQQARLGATPVRRQKEEWKSRARTKWLKMERERVVTGQEGEKREASQACMAIAAD